MEASRSILTELDQYLKKEMISISQFAKLTDLHSGTLSNILNGHRPIAMQQLDRITTAMGLVEGYYYELYIDNYIIEGAPDWRRIGPLIHRCAEMGKLDSIRRVVEHVLDKLAYSQLFFDTAEELYSEGYKEAASILYECVAEGERYQHSERLAVCQYRIFTIALGDNQIQNLFAATRFEPYVERLDEMEQLDALKDLANTYRSLHCWDKVDEFAEKMGRKAHIQYELVHKPVRKWKGTGKKLTRPLFMYIAYSNLLRANVCHERGDYDQALEYMYSSSDLSWVKEQGEEIDYWKNLFLEWTRANIMMTKLLSGDFSVLEQYVAYLDEQKEELITGLLYIMKAANKYKKNVDGVLEHFQTDIEEIRKDVVLKRYSRRLVLDRQASLMYELGQYYYLQGETAKGSEYLNQCSKKYKRINPEKHRMLGRVTEILRSNDNGKSSGKHPLPKT
ncbi:helix-turn-helix domain-containing protein ['Paenibacillus yunnanensis' Narsing Rao et al. 2020]|uniref:helix-turn-helix domain-containing protein n=1 Tax=Paenibacillus tengchongensis TaxID=2608684 RepID=UPI00124F3113|nr:helix-turn-helix transcriptional regulator [Paenibacillus tengchongensis]